MSNYSQLISKLELPIQKIQQNQTILHDSLKKLIYLTVNDQRNFSGYAQRLFKQLSKIISNIAQAQTKLLCLQLMSQMATNFQKLIPSNMYNFSQLINFLSDQNAEVRKAAHYLLLTYVKKYQQIDQILHGYHLKIQASAQQWKTVQKIIHSFQSLLIIEPKCVTYGNNYQNMDHFIQAILEQRQESTNSLIKKASQQAVTSFVKNQYVPLIVQKLSQHIVTELKTFAQKNHINFSSNIKGDGRSQDKKIQKQTQKQKNTSASLTKVNKKIKNNNTADELRYTSKTTITDTSSIGNKNTSASVRNYPLNNDQQKQQQGSSLNINSNKNLKVTTPIQYKRRNQQFFQEDKLELQQINLNTTVGATTQPNKKINLNAKHTKNAQQLKKLVQSIDSSMQWKLKCDTIEQISRVLTTSKPAVSLQEIPQELLEKVLQLTYDYNFKTCITAMNVLLILVNDYNQLTAGNNAKQKKLQEVVIDKICDIKMAVRQIASRILRKIFAEKKNNSKFFLKFLLNKLSTCSVIGKQQILNFLQESYSINSINQTQYQNLSQKIPFDSQISLIVSQVSTLLSNQNTRIKIKTIDCLVKISQSTQIQECKKILQKKLNKVYYDMFLQRLKQKSSSISMNIGNSNQMNMNMNLNSQKQKQRWDDNKNKGATWQATNNNNNSNNDIMAMSQKPFMTKMQFSSPQNSYNTYNSYSINNNKKVNNNNSNSGLDYSSNQGMMRSDQIQIEIGFQDNKKIIRNFNDTKTTGKTNNTFNTFHSKGGSNINNNKNSKGITRQQQYHYSNTNHYQNQDLYQNQNQRDNRDKQNKPTSNSVLSVDDYQPNFGGNIPNYGNSQGYQQKSSIPNKNDGKKLPMKPNPVKKKGNGSNQTIQQVFANGGNGNSINNNDSSSENENLVIQSKQYINKNFNNNYNYQLEQIKEEKPTKMMKFNKNKARQKRQTSLNKQRQKDREDDNTSDNGYEQNLNMTQNNPGKTHSSHKPLFKSQVKKGQGHQIDYKATQYITKQELKPVDSPKQLLKDIINDLPKQNQWNKQFQGLNGLRRLIKHHQDFYGTIQQALPSIMPQVLKLAESLRSTLAKNGMITLSEMCQAFKKSMDPFLQGIFSKLFRKAQDTNTFIVQQVQKCMASLCSYCSCPKICTILLNNAQSKSVPVKTKVIHCIDRLIAKTNYSLQVLKQNPKIAGLLSNYIMDGSAQVRNCSKNIFIRLGQSNSKIQLENLFKRSSSRDAWQKWKIILDKQLNISIGSNKRIDQY